MIRNREQLLRDSQHMRDLATARRQELVNGQAQRENGYNDPHYEMRVKMFTDDIKRYEEWAARYERMAAVW